ncbi:YeeE/YedE family protein [Cognatilysobacter tabacisoli]|jgi:uncharacterized membrane protein YedE/YeeE|uniref:YeeE/YedE family protein n=1 Tax=Cognatilysobacter tabacisoli TaxID=2315424 RepID=UPI000E6AFB01|nr:YeeE/YedE family protein [Lysobacter tabacisoli]
MPTDFTPIPALLGGALIGLAAVVLLWSIGRIAGISGIANHAIEQRDGRDWRIAFLLGLVVAAGLWFTVSGATPRSGFPMPWLVAGGLLVGFGTRLGSGCTSGHGICGLARLSKRSLVAVATFMGAGVATVYVLRHAIGVMA